MKIKVTFTSLFISILLGYVFNNLEPYAFQYKYMIISNSYKVEDEKYAFTLKELLIDRYEQLCFGIDESYHKDVIVMNIDSFEFYNNVTSYYSNGMIVLRVGNGLGYVFKGSLKRNECDDSTINEKFYFFAKYLIV